MIRAAFTLLVLVFATLGFAQTDPDPVPTPLIDAPAKSAKPVAHHKYIVVVLKTQRILTVEDDVVVGNYHCSTGAPGMDTTVGTWKVTEKVRHGRTFDEYGGGALEYELKVPTKTKRGRVRATSIHEYHNVPNYPASHGCIRVQHKSAPHIYKFGEVGMEVDIVKTKPENIH